MISRMTGTSVFSDRTEFSVITRYKDAAYHKAIQKTSSSKVQPAQFKEMEENELNHTRLLPTCSESVREVLPSTATLFVVSAEAAFR